MVVRHRLSGIDCGWIGGFALLGLVLRIAAAQGGLWLDEAWSAKLALQVGTPRGVFLNINHDNSHHLNSLWLQAVGLDAHPVLSRALAIVTGTATIAVAGLIARRSGRLPMIVTALLFSVSPMLVTMGSEARGYAPMTLAFLIAVLLVDRWLAEDRSYDPRLALCLCALFGVFSHLTMVVGLAGIGGWTAITLWRRHGFADASRQSLRLLGPMTLTAALVLAFIALAASQAGGFQIGSYTPFTLLLFLHGVIEMTGFTIGLVFNSIWMIALLAILVICARRAKVDRLDLYRLLIVAFPLLLAILHVGNTGHPRYYLVAAIALLLMLGEMLGRVLADSGGRRVVAAGALVAIAGGSLVHDFELIRNQRGDPLRAIDALSARAPAGTTIILDRDTALAMMESAAAVRHYRLSITTDPCSRAPFLLADRFKGERLPATIEKCGATFRPVTGVVATGLSGTHWMLYERAPKQLSQLSCSTASSMRCERRESRPA